MSCLEPLQKLVKFISDFFLLVYRVHLRSHFGFACRFEPTCSCYAQQAFQQKNPVTALGLVIWRILRCNPFSQGGYDPIPEKESVKHG